MGSVLIVGCDDHSKNMVLKLAFDQETPLTWRRSRTPEAVARVIADLQDLVRQRGVTRIVFAYEASGQGYGLFEQLWTAGIECHVLAPSKMRKSPHDYAHKEDDHDALEIFELLRAHLLAGNRLPTVCVPDPELRDDREVVRAREDISVAVTQAKVRIQALLRHTEGPAWAEDSAWTGAHRAWLMELTRPGHGLEAGARTALQSLLRTLGFLEAEEARLEAELRRVAAKPRYAPIVRALDALPGVAVVLALTYLLEGGDPRRFTNRRSIGAFWGMVPRMHESGESGERKGHITKQGSAYIRRLLCQAVWSRIHIDEDCLTDESKRYQRLVEKNPKHKKIAAVAEMRRLAITLTRLAQEAQETVLDLWPPLDWMKHLAPAA